MHTLWPLPIAPSTPFPLAPDPWSPTGDPSVWTALRAWVKVQFPTVWDDSHLGLHYSGHKRWVCQTSTFFDHLLAHKLPHDPAFETFPLWVQDALRRYQQPRAHWTDYATSAYFPGSASVSVWLYAPEGWWICQRSARVATGRGQWTAPVLGGIDPQDWAVGGLAEYQAACRETLEEWGDSCTDWQPHGWVMHPGTGEIVSVWSAYAPHAPSPQAHDAWESSQCRCVPDPTPFLEGFSAQVWLWLNATGSISSLRAPIPHALGVSFH